MLSLQAQFHKLVDSASGCHPRYSQYYIRRYRIAATDPLLAMLKDQGVPCVPENGQTEEDATTWVLEFPVKSPEGCMTRKDMDSYGPTQTLQKLTIGTGVNTTLV